MRTAAGHYYRLGLALDTPADVGPAWLAAAVTATYPEADLVAVEHYDGMTSVVVVRWRAGEGEISVGDRIAAGAEHVELPAGALPSATVAHVAELGGAEAERSTTREALEAIGLEYNQALKLTGAVAILVAVAYFAGKIRRKHVGTR